MKPAYGDSGVGSSAKYKASTSGYNNHSGSGRYSSPGRKRTGGGTGSGGGKHFKKKHFKKNKNKTKDDKPQGDKKDDKGETKPISFATAFAQGVFSFLALAMIAKSGLFVAHAVSVAAYPLLLGVFHTATQLGAKLLGIIGCSGLCVKDIGCSIKLGFLQHLIE